MPKKPNSPLGQKRKRMFSLSPELYWALDQVTDYPKADIIDTALWNWLDYYEPDVADKARRYEYIYMHKKRRGEL